MIFGSPDLELQTDEIFVDGSGPVNPLISSDLFVGDQADVADSGALGNVDHRNDVAKRQVGRAPNKHVLVGARAEDVKQAGAQVCTGGRLGIDHQRAIVVDRYD